MAKSFIGKNKWSLRNKDDAENTFDFSAFKKR